MDVSIYSQNTAPSTAPLVYGRGAEVVDAQGKRFIDCCSQTLNNNMGQCHPLVQAAVEGQVSRLTYASSRFSSDVSERLHSKLVEITPSALSKVNLASVTGSLANECAVKAARKKTGGNVVISRDRSHLGQSAETMRISGKHYDSKLLGERNARFLPAPHCFRCPMQQKPESCNAECLDGLEDIRKIEGGNIAAVVVEPIMVDAGVLMPPPQYHRRLASFTRSNDIPLVWDEIQTAFGWLGTMFAMDLYKIEPDILTLAKGLGAGFPIAATVLRPEFDVLEYGEHEFTSGANPISCAVSLAMIAHLQNSDELAGVKRKGAILEQRLRALAERTSSMADVRGVGLLIGIEVATAGSNEPDSALTRKIFSELLSDGIITRVSRVGLHSNVIQFKPPIVITEDELDEALTKIERVFLSHETGRQ